MNLWIILGEIAFGLFLLFLIFFSAFSLYEREKRALGRCLFLIAVLVAVNVAIFFFPLHVQNWLFGFVLFIASLTVFFILVSSRPKQSIQIVGRQEQIDERDVIFARFDLEKDGAHYTEYYSRRAERKNMDDEIRKLSDILSPVHSKKNPRHFTLASAEFDYLEGQLGWVDGNVAVERTELSPADNTDSLKNTLDYLGADLCGVCELDGAYVYSHVGRGPRPYGEPILQIHKFAVVFGVEMDFDMVSTAPQSPVIVETGKKYVEAARISIVCAQHIRRMGYPARAHIAGSNYQAVLPPLGWRAGLGELGRLGMLITKKYGPRVRLGLVTTDMPLIPDRPQVLGVQDYCEMCKKCADNCPSKAIPRTAKTEDNGVLKWVLNREECYRYWRKVGTDCAVCMSVCPYSKPANAFHDSIRWATAFSKNFQNLSLRADDFFYGRFPKRKSFPL